MTKIEWTKSIDKDGNVTKGKSLNVMTGCTPISEGCKNCFAKNMTKRLKAMGQHKYREEFKPMIHEEELMKLPKWKKPRKIFVNSMSDTFHKDFSNSSIYALFSIMGLHAQHTYQILTKRSERLIEMNEFIYWRENLWMGVSVELKKYYSRIYDLLSTDAKVKFLSCEPLLGPLPDLPLNNGKGNKIDWVIVGGESGFKSKVRKMELEWARDIRDQCIDAGVKFFYKQGGTLNQCNENEMNMSLENRGMFSLDINVTKVSHKTCTSKGCRYLDGEIWEEMP